MGSGNLKSMRRFSVGNFLLALLVVGGLGWMGHAFALKLTGPALYIAEGSSAKAAVKKPPAHIVPPAAVKGIYMSSWVAGAKKWRSELAAFADETEVNAIVIDIKDYTGRISFLVQDGVLVGLGYSENRIPDIKEFIEELHAKNIYVIGRIAVFQDPHLAKVRPNLAIKRAAGGVWKDKQGLAWVDPASSDVWDIAARIGKEAENVGFDELNYDYVRFPSDGNLHDIRYPFWDGKKSKAEVIAEFFAYLSRELETAPVPISADLFGLTTWNKDDLNIGQVLELALPHFDYVSPMVYPSHYPAGFQGYKNPAQHPYEVIKTAMERARDRAVAIGENPQKLRPWIQDFDLGADYDASMIKLQKQAVYDAGLVGWLSWDPANKYTRGGYEGE